MKRTVLIFGVISVTNAAMTFLEPFPVGLVMTVVSAGILRRRQPAATVALA